MQKRGTQTESEVIANIGMYLRKFIENEDNEEIKAELKECVEKIDKVVRIKMREEEENGVPK